MSKEVLDERPPRRLSELVAKWRGEDVLQGNNDDYWLGWRQARDAAANELEALIQRRAHSLGGESPALLHAQALALEEIGRVLSREQRDSALSLLTDARAKLHSAITRLDRIESWVKRHTATFHVVRTSHEVSEDEKAPVE